MTFTRDTSIADNSILPKANRSYIFPYIFILFARLVSKAAISGLTFFLSNPRYFEATVTTVSFFFDISQ